jgi:hypothetical protein
MTDWLTVNSTHPEIMSASISPMYGGHNLTIYVSPNMVDTIKWVQQYRSQLEREQQIRSHDPAAQELYDEYQTYISLVHK